MSEENFISKIASTAFKLVAALVLVDYGLHCVEALKCGVENTFSNTLGGKSRSI